MIDAAQYDLLREEIDRNIGMSTKVLAELYPEFY